MSFLDGGFLGDDLGLGKNIFEKAGKAVSSAVSKAGREAFRAAAKAENAAAVVALEAANRARAEAAGAKILAAASKKVAAPVADAAAQAYSAMYEAAQKSGKAVEATAKQASGAVGTAAKRTGIVVTDALKTAAKATVGLVSRKGGRVVDADGGPVALTELDLLGWSVFADPAVPGDPTLSPGTDAEAMNPAWPGYFAVKGSERIGPFTWERLQAEILKRPIPAIDASGTQATWQGWAFWMAPATPGDPSAAEWPGFYAEKAGTRTALGTADAVMKDVQARESANMPDQELPPSETNPYLGWALWWRPSEGDAGLYGKKNGVETIHGTADVVATDIQNREKANQPQPSGGAEKYSGQDYQGWQIWTSATITHGPNANAPSAAMQQQWFGVQGGVRTPLYADVQQLYTDIQSRAQPQQPTADPWYQPSPYAPIPALPAPYQPSSYAPPSASPAPMTGGGGSFTPSGMSLNPMASGGYREGGFLTPGYSGTVSASDEGAPSADGREEEASEEAAEDPSASDEAEEFEFEDSELNEGPPRSFSRGSAVDGLGTTPSLPSAILPLAGVALLWYLVTRK